MPGRGVRRGGSGLRGAARARTRAANRSIRRARICRRCCGRTISITTNTGRLSSGHDKALWLAEGLPFRVEFFHPGYLYQEPVHINEFTPTYTQPIRFVQDFFNYRALHIQNEIPANTGYAGFKAAQPVERAGQMGRTRRVSGRELFPAARAKTSVTARPRAAWRSIAAGRGRRNFPSSPTGGWASRSRTTTV